MFSRCPLSVARQATKALVMKSNLIHAVAGAVLAAVVAATAADAQAPPAAQQGPEAPLPQTAPLLIPSASIRCSRQSRFIRMNCLATS